MSHRGIQKLMAKRLADADGCRGHLAHQLAHDARVGQVALPDVGILNQGFHPKQVDELPDTEESECQQIQDPGAIPAQVDPVYAGESYECEAPEGVSEPFPV
ncbi:MAG: hypothetical protein P8Y04_13400 [Desulfobulbaceae bacterium]